MSSSCSTKASASSAAAPTKRKKKGRPSLLELQKRNLRLQKLQHEANAALNPNPSQSPARLPSSAAPLRRSARRNPDASAEPSASSGEDDGSSNGRRRREKKLRLVLQLSPCRRHGSDSLSGPESDSAAAEYCCKAASQHPTSKATDPLQEPVDSGPTTPLPDSKLLVFILDRLQKKDTYGVFSEPVDPNELPDYHDIIEHPMDFATIRKKVGDGAYANLEQFEKDVFLISSNAMRYNSPDTIYFRQARAIQEIAKKDFENLRQESDDNEQEHTKPARRGRPSSKVIFKKFGRPPAECAASDFSSATLANSGDNVHCSKVSHDLSQNGSDISLELLTKLYGPRILEAHNLSELKSEKNRDHSGSTLKNSGMKYGKKLSVIDENRRMSYKESRSSNPEYVPLALMASDGSRKQLMSIGLQMEHACARSLARFAADLGPIGWDVASKKIERVLPPRTKFGRGWIGENDIPQYSAPILFSKFPKCSSKPETLLLASGVSADERSLNDSIVETIHTSATDLSTATSSTNRNR